MTYMSNSMEFKPNKNEKGPEFISKKLKNFFFHISDANSATKGRENNLDKKQKEYLRLILGDKEERKEKGLISRSYVTEFGIGTKKVETPKGFYYQILISDQYALEQTFSKLLTESRDFWKKSSFNVHDAIVEILFEFNRALLDDEIDGEDKLEIIHFVRNTLDTYIKKFDALYKERGAYEEEYLSDSSAYKEIIETTKALMGNYFEEYKILEKNRLIFPEDINDEICTPYLFLREDNLHENEDAMQDFILYLKQKMALVISLDHIEKKDKNDKYRSFIGEVKQHIIKNNSEFIKELQHPEMFKKYSLENNIKGKFDEKLIKFLNEVNEKLTTT